MHVKYRNSLFESDYLYYDNFLLLKLLSEHLKLRIFFEYHVHNFLIGFIVIVNSRKYFWLFFRTPFQDFSTFKRNSNYEN